MPPDLFNSKRNIAERNQKQFVMNCAQNNDFDDSISSSTGTEALISESNVPIMQVGLLQCLSLIIRQCTL